MEILIKFQYTFNWEIIFDCKQLLQNVKLNGSKKLGNRNSDCLQ